MRLALPQPNISDWVQEVMHLATCFVLATHLNGMFASVYDYSLWDGRKQSEQWCKVA